MWDLSIKFGILGKIFVTIKNKRTRKVENKMKKIIISLMVIALSVGTGIWIWKSNQNNTADYRAEKSSTNNNKNNIEFNTTKVTKKETEIAKFSTKIHNKESERQNNIGITCKTLSGKEVNPGETFSFCDIVGKATTEKGYQEADIYVEGKKEKGLGGGNCQVSTTLYNAVLKVQGLEVLERHKHSGHVPYIEEGKDAAVSYGSYDFKFKNNTDNVIKIVMENTESEIIAKLIKIES